MSDSTDASFSLLPGEEQLWTGRPDRHVWFAPIDRFAIPVGIGFIAFGIFWEHGVLTARATNGGHRYPPFFAIWGALLLAFFITSTVGEVVLRRYRLRRTTYVLTTRRAIAHYGRQLAETPASHPIVIWSLNKSHVSVVWLTKPAPRMPKLLNPVLTHRVLARSGVVVFANIRDGATLVRLVENART